MAQPAVSESGEPVAVAAVIADLDDRTAAGIAAAVSRAIRSGTIGPGTRLPTVRELARELRVSPATVNQAWRALAGTGAIVARGRAGTFVGSAPPGPAAVPIGRYQRLHPRSDNTFRVDLSRGVPDPELLPDLTGALRVLARDGAIDQLSATYLGDAMLPDLAAVVAEDWPSRAERFTVLDGALDAIDRLLSTHVRLGDAVLVENPCFPPFLDLLTRLGARAVPVAMDQSGPLPGELAAAVATHDPSALLLQPRAQNPTGASLSARRVRELADILAGTDVLVIEDDHAAGIAHAPARSLGARLPQRTVHIRSYSKSHGADLRLAVAGGPAAVLDPVIERRMLGPGWSSRLLQRVLLHMLTDPAARTAVADARAIYRTRAEALRKSLAHHGITVPRPDGINLWFPVADENAAMISLAAAGIKAAPGGPFEVVDHPAGDHLRITIAAIPDGEIATVAAHLAAAATALPTYRRIRRG
ncbi:aminotransferase class I/II-fold pyridoxal phosphate-dependent enzyme [Nocardia sp. CDC159]|uniref:Aminotransferase class I/II-fold pyridoxal phosphate-dependent enzyme n=1 Tax=Nocardia pulmonis TaxID=2951408 RepID=A0A9X2EC65_9NOCA|nr:MULTISPECIES: aminotransferase class I/II-fold pyridoxal phosphate-dependent enzyme [Nocardia]MCM6775513.1 aminotransferase class I/II-fold pyridoxal phosphate-dependent enzyme [Nocardia pulmonis]MCM6787753.1 aminotransferase class I/II-fold pyridoxal phosphate-dependent enzyme [Nocardia sp. CDC159]